MLKHSGSKRTHKHNVQLAVMLGLNAGFVNAAGFLGFAVLTTNVTGHAALFAERIAAQDWQTARVVALWMLLFLAGAFVSSLMVTLLGRNQRFYYVFPMLTEILVLLAVALFGHQYNGSLLAKEIFCGSLLFAMGVQNSLVSIVSGSAVRTTHLTGTFTDLGIELAQLFAINNGRVALIGKIKLHSTIILFFMVGALMGAYGFTSFNFRCFLFPVGVLIFTLVYDVYQISIKRYYRKFRKSKFIS